MLTRKGQKSKKKQIKVQAIQVLKPSNNVKKLRALPWNCTLPGEQSVAKCWPLSQKREVEKRGPPTIKGYKENLGIGIRFIK